MNRVDRKSSFTRLGHEIKFLVRVDAASFKVSKF